MKHLFFSDRRFGTVLEHYKGVGPGFDLLRILLACVIFYGHAKWLSGRLPLDGLMDTVSVVAKTARLEEGGWEGWKRPLLVSFVPAFFALSGFLVSASAIRTRVTSTFLAHRALRIFPALVVEVTLSALILGLFLTSLTTAQYLSDPQFFRYFGNILGFVTFYLPGVFETNPVKGIVNVNLWTLPSEFYCYLITAFFMMTRIFYSRKTITAIILPIWAILFLLNLLTDFAVTSSIVPIHTVTFYFFVGVLFYHWKDCIPYNIATFIVAGALGYITQMQHHLVYLAPIFVVYCTIFVGLTNIPLPQFLRKGDYSYGIYLYGFPITQFVVTVVPGARGNGTMTLLVSAALTFAFAAMSWHLIEKPTLNLKRKLSQHYFPRRRKENVPVTPDQRKAETTEVLVPTIISGNWPTALSRRNDPVPSRRGNPKT